ncbi:MAG TPA: response regulator [Verrucomicrobiae bacterium]|nr:response regulator [Verrucomicrobiae bacterium]
MANILLVEDNESLRLAYSNFLSQEGHQVFTASNVDDALAYLASSTPNIILLDMLLPKKNGLDLLKEYDVINTHPDVKVVAFSNYTEIQVQTEAQRLGASLYLTKSLTDPKELVDTINQLLTKE